MDNYKNKQVFKKYNSCRKTAIIRNLPFSLEMRDFVNLYNAPCYYCGFPNPQGIDRVDSSIGYIVTNVVSCCHICNTMKMHLHARDFILQCYKIAKCHGNAYKGYTNPQQVKDSIQKREIDHTVKGNEKQLIKECLIKNSGIITKAADELGISRNTIYRKIKKYEL